MAAYRDKKKNGIWRWRRMVTNPHTKERRRLSGTPEINTMTAATAAEEAAVKDFIRDPAKQPARVLGVTVKEAAARFLVHMQSRVVVEPGQEPDLAPSYLLKLEGILRNHVIVDLGDMRLADVNDETLRDWLERLRLKPLGLRGHALKAAQRAQRPVETPPETPVTRIKARTIRDILRGCHGLFVWAVGKKLVGAVPAFPKAPKPPKRQPAYLTLEETERLLAAAEDEDARMAMLIAVRSGLREGELMALRWSEIELQNNRILVARAYQKGRGSREILGLPKAKTERIVDVSPAFIAELRAYRHLKELVCSDMAGVFRTRGYFHRVLRKAKAAAGITKPFRWHDLRHTFGSHMASAEIDLQTIQHWMGHASITTTEIYAHFMPSRGQLQVQKLAAGQAGEGQP